MKFFDGCTALITGASAGLGAEFARQLAPYAHCLVLVARRNDRLQELRAELSSKFPSLSVFSYPADLAIVEQRVALAKWLDDQGIRVDFLINNAGLGAHGPFEGNDWNRFKTIIEVNIIALTHLTHLLLPMMRKTGRAAILNVSSVAGFFPLPNTAVYSATKAYVTSFSEALRMELKGSGISVTALCPGPVKTEFFDVAYPGGAEERKTHYDEFPAFVLDPSDVVYAALCAVARDRARVIPGLLLCAGVTLALLLPFCLVRKTLERKRSRL